ncbi:hypothetical protein PROFUN_15146 [Planoprotostelium fungivorum]|uniref:Uncharacterized protein n=1 Tax=Planoprotostelium fungivorum TaxID=1890364 RepID=A0A2P6MXQ6_9EUKA|nr:hypothetical protein PROFUN_15146 [Planoprotostelium fungivorum]
MTRQPVGSIGEGDIDKLNSPNHREQPHGHTNMLEESSTGVAMMQKDVPSPGVEPGAQDDKLVLIVKDYQIPASVDSNRNALYEEGYHLPTNYLPVRAQSLPVRSMSCDHTVSNKLSPRQSQTYPSC